MKLNKIAYALTAIFLIAASAQAQERKTLSNDEQSQYVVSAKAGIVNIAEGDVSYERGGKVDMLIASDVLRPGDVVRTGRNGRAEILLNPGSYLRLSTNSEFSFSDTTIHMLELKLLKGSAIIEASVIEEAITVITPQGKFPLVNGGLYRFNVGANGSSEIITRKGKAEVGGVMIKEGKKAMITVGAPVITSFNKKSEDDFDIWSRDRAKIIVAANNKLSNRALRRNTSLSMSGNAWIFNPFWGTYTYLPGYWGIYSPYGYGYNRCSPYERWHPNSQSDCRSCNGRRREGGSGSGSTGNYSGGTGGVGTGGSNTGGSSLGGGIIRSESGKGLGTPPIAPPSSPRRTREH